MKRRILSPIPLSVADSVLAAPARDRIRTVIPLVSPTLSRIRFRQRGRGRIWSAHVGDFIDIPD